MKNYRTEFQILENQKGLVYLDSASTTLKPKTVVEKLVGYYTDYTANIHRGIYKNAQKADEEFEKVRRSISLFIGSKLNKEVIFVSGATMGLNLISNTIGKANVTTGDEVVVTEMEHHSNIVPWQMLCQEKRAKLKWLEVGKSHEANLDTQNLEKIVTRKTRVFAITHASNVLGTINDLKNLTKTIKRVSPSCLVVVDGAQSVPHMPMNVSELGCDFLAFSGHKIYGPTGVGVLWGREELLNEMGPWMGGGDMIKKVSMRESSYKDNPGKFEAGTPHIGGVIGLGAAIEWLESKGSMVAVREHEKEITKYALDRLGEIHGLEVYGPLKAEERSGLVAFNLKGVHPHDVAQILADRNICVRAGHHCAQPLHDKLGVNGSVRASFGIYTSKEDIDKLIDGLGKVKKKFGV